MRNRLVVGRAGFDVFRPAHEQRHAQAAFGEVALRASERAVAAKKRGVTQTIFLRCVVAGEENNGVLGELRVVELLQELTHRGVEMRDGGGLALLRSGPLLRSESCRAAEILRRHVGARLLARVGQREREVQKEGAKLVELRSRKLGEVVRRASGEQVLRVVGLQAIRVHENGQVVSGRIQDGVVEEPLQRVVPRDHGGELVRRVPQFEQPEPLVHALLLRHSRRAVAAETPLADDAGVVARALEHLRERRVLAAQRDRVAVRPVVATDARVASVLAREERPARGRTAGAARVGLREAHPLAGEAVEVRRGKLLLPVATQVSPAQIVREDDDDVRAGLIRGGLLGR